jgi:hypothetical protein
VSRGDALWVAGVGAALALALGVGVARGRTGGIPTTALEGWQAADRPLSLSHAASQRERIDPLRPPGLPEGASVDPETGFLVGVDASPEAGDAVLHWSELDRPEHRTPAELPEALRALDGRMVVIVGFGAALYDPYSWREFVVVGSHFACCFGAAPGPGGLIPVSVARANAAPEPTLDPLRVRGRLRLLPTRLSEEPDSPILALFRIEDAEARPLR